MRDGVFDNISARQLFSHGDPEVSVWADYTTPDDEDRDPVTHRVKCRADWLRADGICVDLKTCACSSPDKFAKDCARFGYDLQDIHYTQTLNSAGRECSLFAFVAVESEPPYLCQVYTLNKRSRAVARQRFDRALVRLAECQATNIWPGYAKPLYTLALPAWHLKESAA
jgi:hypothetical protein